jgi:endonuclease/exonuclease/phosphatase family metal-dependent hydrolase
MVAGDFNDYASSPALRYLEQQGLHNITAEAKGLRAASAKRRERVLATYRYQGRWESIDHILISAALLDKVRQTYINDAPFLLEEDKMYGGVKPLRTFNGYRYQRGFSDHLPLVARFRW